MPRGPTFLQARRQKGDAPERGLGMFQTHVSRTPINAQEKLHLGGVDVRHFSRGSRGPPL